MFEIQTFLLRNIAYLRGYGIHPVGSHTPFYTNIMYTISVCVCVYKYIIIAVAHTHNSTSRAADAMGYKQVYARRSRVIAPQARRKLFPAESILETKPTG